VVFDMGTLTKALKIVEDLACESTLSRPLNPARMFGHAARFGISEQRRDRQSFLYDRNDCKFGEWLQRYIELFQDETSFDIPHSHVLFSVMRTSDFDTLERNVDVDKIPDAFSYYFKAGQFDRLRSLSSWPSIAGNTAELPVVILGPAIDEYEANVATETWSDTVRLCEHFARNEILGTSEMMLGLYTRIQDLARSVAAWPDHRLPNILINGEAGSGKSSLARAVHSLCDRHSGRFAAISCGRLGTEVGQSELFGHEKGAFTGAEIKKEGHLLASRGGSVLFNDINKLPAAVHSHLLDVFEERKNRSVGSTLQQDIRDVLLICTSNESLDSRERGNQDDHPLPTPTVDFPQDLYQRISENVITVPPLELRWSDVPLLIESWLRKRPTNLDQYRFQLACLLMDKVRQEDMQVRELHALVSNYLIQCAPPYSPRENAVVRALDEFESSGKSMPVSKADLARKIKWNEKVGISSSVFYDANWKLIIEKYVESGRIRSRE
jgi:DNA-binding NtrC family response regulator